MKTNNNKMDVTFAELQEKAKEHFVSTAMEGKDLAQSSLSSVRSQILHLSCLVGKMSSSFLEHAPMDKSRAAFTELDTADSDEQDATVLFQPPQETQQCMGDVLMGLFIASHTCSLNLQTCIRKKLLLNERKYPVELCKGKSDKYTNYSAETGITKETGQSTVDDGASANDNDDSDRTIHQVQLLIRKFATDRLFSRFHMPRSLVLALLAELGEVAELFQWKGDGEVPIDGRGGEQPQLLSTEELDSVGQELADVAIYLLRLSDVCGVDIGGVAAASKI